MYGRDYKGPYPISFAKAGSIIAGFSKLAPVAILAMKSVIKVYTYGAPEDFHKPQLLRSGARRSSL